MAQFLRIALLVAAAACGPALAADEEVDARPAMDAAQAWLAAIDAGRYGQSWDSAAANMQESVARAKWETMLEAARAPLGTVIHRKVRSASFARIVPDAPAGEYLVIQYDTRFENRPLGTELVTPMRDRDGKWRVSSYVIR